MTRISPVPVAPPPPPPAPPVSSPVAPPAAEAQGGYQGSLYDPQLVDQAYTKVRAMSEIQFDWPLRKPPEPPPQWLIDLIGFFGRNSTPLTWLFYVLAALLVLYILYRIFPQFRDWVDKMVGRVNAQDDDSVWQPEIERARELLGEADSLAAQGRYAEAVHLLLWRSIEDIGRRRPRLLRPSLTARDIARHPELPDVARGAFTTIADVVELSLFGRRPVDAEGWQRCRDAYSRFALRENWVAYAAPAPFATDAAEVPA